MNINKMIYDDMILSNAVHYAANQAHHAVGYNTVYHFLPGIDVKYDLLDKGPERIHDDQYRSQVEAEYGKLIDPTKENLTKDQLFWKMEEVFRRISVYEDSVLVRRVEGKQGMHTSYHRDGKGWMDQLVAIYKKSNEYHLINPTGKEPVFDEGSVRE